MRVTTAIWFAIFKHQETSRGAFVTVVKSGAQQAGAIFIMQNLLDGTYNLFAPAPQIFISQSDEDDRQFECVLEGVSENEINAYMEKQKNFDPDLWLIETESGKGTIALNLVKNSV